MLRHTHSDVFGSSGPKYAEQSISVIVIKKEKFFPEGINFVYINSW